MKVVIPYREKSERCERKNTKSFFNKKSILEISINELSSLKKDVFLACIPSETSLKRVADFQVNKIDLSESTSTGDWSSLAVEVANSLLDEELIAIMFCTNPLFFKFNNLSKTLDEAVEKTKKSKSAMVVYPFKHYVLNQDMQGINHQQGPWHQYSQNLPQWYINPWFLIVTSPYQMIKYKYWYTPDVAPIVASGPCVDIDTEEDFNLAKIIYESL
jgi:CMP-N-acetylneuraminic acid synthetase